MSMANDSITNEKLISTIIFNLENNCRYKKPSIIYNTIINNTILNRLKSLPCNKAPRSEKDHRKNISIAIKILRKYLPYNTACFCVRNPDCNTLYHSISDFKYKINTNFYSLFNYK